MRKLLALLVLLLLVLPAHGQIVIRREAGGGGCTPIYTETDWDDLTGWTQSDNNHFAANATTDQLDVTGTTFDYGEDLTHEANSTTNGDMCVFAKIVSWEDDLKIGFLARTSTVNTEFTYGFEHDWGGTSYFFRSTMADGGPTTWVSKGTTSLTKIDDGDYVSFCVSDTSTNTKFEFWDHGSSDPGDCRSDWGAATWTVNGCSSNCNDSAYTHAGIYSYSEAGADFDGVWDEFSITDY